MAQDPISELKDQLSVAQTMCEDLRACINSSDQSSARAKLKQIEDSLIKVHDKMRLEFGWLMPQRTSEE